MNRTSRVFGSTVLVLFAALFALPTFMTVSIQSDVSDPVASVLGALALWIAFPLISPKKQDQVEFKQPELSQDETSRSNNFVEFIDILFAVVIAEGFVYISTTSNGVVQWFESANLLPIVNTISAFTLVIYSWVRYHPSVKAFPERTPYRFAIDVILLLLYYFGITSVSSFLTMSIVFIAVFSSYSVWTFLRWKEYRQHEQEGVLHARVKDPVRFTILFIAVLLVQLAAKGLLPELLLPLICLVLLLQYRGLKRIK